MKEIIRLDNIKRDFHVGDETVHALRGVSFTIREGEFVTIMGTSGSGKSTLLNTLGCLDTPTSGEYYLDGVSVRTMNKRQRATLRNRKIGFVFQNYHLLPKTTAVENVEIASQLSKDPLDSMAVMKQVGLADRALNFPAQLSGGEQQRVAIARALAKNPKLLLCDEPTGALDYETGKAILKLLQDTCRKSGMTVVIITHNSALTAMADRVVKIKNGTVASVSINENPESIENIEW